jgi:histidinol-phosphate aminotransferase
VTKGLADAGAAVPDAQGNFVWFATGERTEELAAAADELGIVVRPYAADGARVSIGEPEANDRTIELGRAWSGRLV